MKGVINEIFQKYSSKKNQKKKLSSIRSNSTSDIYLTDLPIKSSLFLINNNTNNNNNNINNSNNSLIKDSQQQQISSTILKDISSSDLSIISPQNDAINNDNISRIYSAIKPQSNILSPLSQKNYNSNILDQREKNKSAKISYNNNIRILSPVEMSIESISNKQKYRQLSALTVQKEKIIIQNLNKFQRKFQDSIKSLKKQTYETYASAKNIVDEYKQSIRHIYHKNNINCQSAKNINIPKSLIANIYNSNLVNSSSNISSNISNRSINNNNNNKYSSINSLSNSDRKKSNINKENDNSENIISSIDSKNIRLPNYQVHPINFQKKLGFYPALREVYINKIIVNNLDFQQKEILNELNIIFDNFDNFKYCYCGYASDNIFGKELFPNMSYDMQKKTNQLIEETVSLINEIPFYLLGKFYNEMEKMIGKIPVNLHENSIAQIEDEEKWAKKNMDNLISYMMYLKKIKEYYLELCYNGNNLMRINYKEYYILKNYLERIRYNCNSLKLISANCYKNQVDDLKKLIKLKKVNVDFNNNNNNKFKNKYNIKTFKIENSSIENIRNKSDFKNVERNKLKKINLALENSKLDVNLQELLSDRNTRKPAKKGSGVINSKLVRDCFRHFSPKVQNQIMAMNSIYKKLVIC